MHYCASNGNAKTYIKLKGGPWPGKIGASQAVRHSSISRPSPSRYRHWKARVDGDVATLTRMLTRMAACSRAICQAQSYDLGVDIELADVVPAACASSIPR